MLLACIYANSSHLPSALIYKGTSYDLNNSWLEDLGETIVYFVATNNRWNGLDPW
jgi:hypothetical protein